MQVKQQPPENTSISQAQAAGCSCITGARPGSPHTVRAAKLAKLFAANPVKPKGVDLMFGKVKSLRELFGIELSYAYDCEQKLVEKGLPTMIEKASSPELRSALQQHLEETRGHVKRLERVFSALGTQPDTKGNDVLDKMMSAAKDSVSNIDDPPLRDAALIVNGNFVEHYEIALYGSLAAFAKHLGLQDAVGPLEQTLQEEKAADAKLTQIGQKMLNIQAAKQTAS
jgi:ferritin-like metal-binding protein YciE